MATKTKIGSLTLMPGDKPPTEEETKIVGVAERAWSLYKKANPQDTASWGANRNTWWTWAKRVIQGEDAPPAANLYLQQALKEYKAPVPIYEDIPESSVEQTREEKLKSNVSSAVKALQKLQGGAAAVGKELPFPTNQSQMTEYQNNNTFINGKWYEGKAGVGGATSGVKTGIQEGDTRVNPVTGVTEVYRPDGTWGAVPTPEEIDKYPPPPQVTGAGTASGAEDGAGAVVDTSAQDEQDRQDASDEANKLAQEIFDSIGEDDIDVRDSSKLLVDLKEKIEEGLGEVETEKPESLADLFKAEKTRLGIDVLEQEIADLDSEIETIQTNLLVEAEKAGEKVISTREIGRAKGVLQKRADREIALLNIERNAVARTINNKLTTLETIMSLSQTDVSNASAYYDRQLTRGIQLYNLIRGEEEAEITRAEKATQQAQVSLNTITNLFKALKTSFADLSEANKQSIRKLELEAGMPIGITEAFMNAKPEAEVMSTTTSYDAAGNQQVTFIYKGADGKAGTVEIVRTGGAKAPTAPTSAEKETVELDTIKQALLASRGEDGKVDPGVYQGERERASIGPAEFDKRFSYLLSSRERVNLGIDKEADEELTPEEFKNSLIKYKEAGYSREEAENIWKKEADTDIIPSPIKKIFIEVWGKVGIGEKLKFWE